LGLIILKDPPWCSLVGKMPCTKRDPSKSDFYASGYEEEKVVVKRRSKGKRLKSRKFSRLVEEL